MLSSPEESNHDKPTHKVLVTNTSINMVNITGPTLAVPKNVATMGTPMNPVLGHVATNAPKKASLHPILPRLVITIQTKTVMSALAT
jgi:hypothetical protein